MNPIFRFPICDEYTLPGLVGKGAIENKKIEQSKITVPLDIDTKKHLYEYAQKISKLEIYDISEINLSLSQITIINEQVNTWVNSITEAVNSFDEERFRLLLKATRLS